MRRDVEYVTESTYSIISTVPIHGHGCALPSSMLSPQSLRTVEEASDLVGGKKKLVHAPSVREGVGNSWYPGFVLYMYDYNQLQLTRCWVLLVTCRYMWRVYM